MNITGSENQNGNVKTKDEIVKAALYLFSRHGYKAVSVRMICDMSKANVSAISYHFGGKEELFRHCLKKNKEENEFDFDSLFNREVRSKEDCVAVIESFVRSFFEHGFKNFDAIKMLIKEAAMDNSIAEGILLELHQKSATGFQSFLVKAQNDGFINKEIDITVVRKIIYSLVAGDRKSVV